MLVYMRSKKRKNSIATAYFICKQKGVFKREKAKQILHPGKKKMRESKTKRKANVTIME